MVGVRPILQRSSKQSGQCARRDDMDKVTDFDGFAVKLAVSVGPRDSDS